MCFLHPNLYHSSVGLPLAKVDLFPYSGAKTASECNRFDNVFVVDCVIVTVEYFSTEVDLYIILLI